MRTRVATLLAFALAAAPAAAQDGSVTVADPCGDAPPEVVRIQGSTFSLGIGREARHDLERVRLSPIPGGGVQALLDVCGDIPAGDTFPSTWAVRADLEGACGLTVALRDLREGAALRRSAAFIETCTAPGTIPGTFQATDTFAAELPASAWSVSADKITIRLLADDLPSAAAARVAPGTAWNAVSGSARDGARVTVVENSDPQVAVTGPGSRDETATGGTFITP